MKKVPKILREMVLILIFRVLTRMARKAMKKRTVKVATKEPLTATMKKNNNEQLTSVASLLTNFQLDLESLSTWEPTPKLMIFSV